MPSKDIVWNEERGHYDFGELNWDEFFAVIKGNGPCNRQRLAHHKKAHDEGEWVREAAKAYEAKKKARAEQAA